MFQPHRKAFEFEIRYYNILKILLNTTLHTGMPA